MTLRPEDFELAKLLGWSVFGTHLDFSGDLEFAGEGEDGLPVWERPDRTRVFREIYARIREADVPTHVAADIDQILYELGDFDGDDHDKEHHA